METSVINAIQRSDIDNNFTEEEVRRIVEAPIKNQSSVVTVLGHNIIIILYDVM